MIARIAVLFAVTLATVPASADEDSSEPLVAYDDGLRIGRSSDIASAKLSGRVQARYEGEREARGETESEVRLPRIRAAARGHLLTRRLSYHVQLAFEKGFEIKDANLEVAVIEDQLLIRAGKFKRPTYRDFLTSSGKLALVDRGITHSAFDGDRDIGVMAHNDLTSSKRLTWAVAVFRDTSDRIAFADRGTIEEPDPLPFEPSVAVRLGVNGGPIKGFDDIDWKGAGPPPAWSTAISALQSIDTEGDGGNRLRAAFDYSVQHGHVSLTGDVHLAASEAGYDGWGFHQQLAALLFGTLGPVARVAVVDPTGDDVTTELTGGLNWFLREHKLKLTGDVSMIRGDGDDLRRARVQVQVVF